MYSLLRSDQPVPGHCELTMHYATRLARITVAPVSSGTAWRRSEEARVTYTFQE
jgi:hypothetical protein